MKKFTTAGGIMTEVIEFKPIGIIHSPFKSTENIPIQSHGGKGIAGTVEIAPELTDGLKDIDGFSHIILLYYFHKSEGYSLIVKPFLEEKLRGVFSTRAPKRPNSIGLSIVKLVKVEGNRLFIEDVDMLDGTPLLDIKPYVPGFDDRKDALSGWLSEIYERSDEARSDGRFK
jgi:tRNA-Thr(GGU) m(6)t(6)A37 methyltransferase TsaA